MFAYLSLMLVMRQFSSSHQLCSPQIKYIFVKNYQYNWNLFSSFSKQALSFPSTKCHLYIILSIEISLINNFFGNTFHKIDCISTTCLTTPHARISITILLNITNNYYRSYIRFWWPYYHSHGLILVAQYHYYYSWHEELKFDGSKSWPLIYILA